MADPKELKKDRLNGRKGESQTKLATPLNSQPPLLTSKTKEPPVPSCHRKLLQVVSREQGVGLDRQLSLFMSVVTMNEEEIQRRHEILEDLKRILVKDFPEVRLHPFGSLITGLGDNESDLDIYIDCNGSSE